MGHLEGERQTGAVGVGHYSGRFMSRQYESVVATTIKAVLKTVDFSKALEKASVCSSG